MSEFGDKSKRSQVDKRGREIEYRVFRADATDAGFSGYASTFWDTDSYATAFAPGAFAKSINERSGKVLVLWQHDPYLPIGKPTRMAEDERGLAVDAHITEAATYGRDAMALLRDGIPLGLSIGFRTIRERPATEDDPLILTNAPEPIKRDPSLVYVIEEAKLYEFSVVSFPANEAAQIDTVRSEAQIEALALALADLKADRLDAARRAVVADLVAAWRAAPAGSRPAPRNAKAPHASIALLSEELAYLLTA